MKALLGVIAVVFTLSPAVGIAQTPRQLKSERFAKQAECFREAKLKRFRRNFAARNQFMKQCMARSLRQGMTAEKATGCL